MEIEIGILTGGLVCMALLVVVQSRNVLRRNQNPPDQALVLMVQDLVNRVLEASRREPQHGIYRIPKSEAPGPTTAEVRDWDVVDASQGDISRPAEDAAEDPPDTAVRRNEM